MATFLYPRSRQFPFDEACEQIVRALEERSWKVPGIIVDFHGYGDPNQSYRRVGSIRGADFKLKFGRIQARLGRWDYDTAAVTEAVIPKRELHVFSDGSGPTYIEYVGRCWRADKEGFLNGSKVHSKLRGERRTYLMYAGGCDCEAGAVSFPIRTGGERELAKFRHTHDGRRSPVLVHTSSLGREYDPRGREPRAYRTEEVLAEFTRWLEANVLAAILAQPV